MIPLSDWRRRSLLAHLADEPKAAAGHRAYEALLFAAVADCMPRGGDPAGQRGFGDDAPVPDRGEQVILAGDAVPVLDEIGKQIEYLRLDLDQLVPAAQLATLQVENIVTE
jgi:hypothetical protein